MSSVTGHITNHAHIKIYRSLIEGLGSAYQTTNTQIQTVNIDLVISNQAAAFKLVRTKGNIWVLAVNSRVQAIGPLSKLLTKVLNALKSTEAKPEIVSDARSLINKIKGIRATPKIKMDPADPASPSDETIKQISSAQTDIDHVIENFATLIDLLNNEILYDPSEEDIKITSLEDLLTKITAANDAVVNAFPALDNARILRNKLIYNEGGSNELASKIKQYVLSVFGARSPQYRQFTRIKFTNPKL